MYSPLDPPTFIAQLMGISWGALAGAFLAPFLYGLYWKGVTKAAVWVSFISQKMDKGKLDDIFICLKEKVLVSKRKSIEE